MDVMNVDVMNTFEYLAEMRKIDDATTPEALVSLEREFRSRFDCHPVLADLLHALHTTALARYGAGQWAGYLGVARPASQPTLQAAR